MNTIIKREDFKHNFLANIIIRFDFKGIFENELEKSVSNLKEMLKEHHYDYIRKEHAQEIDFKINDPEFLGSIPPANVKKQPVYIFNNEEKGLIFKISPTFAIINNLNKKYISFSEYAPFLIEIINLLQKTPFFNITRFGIRKINICILKDINKLYDYFNKEHFYLYDQEGTQTYQQSQTYTKEEYNINLIRNIILGKYDEQPAYQIAIDADIYTSSKEKIIDIIQNESQINTMNDILFEIYTNMLTNKLIKQLSENEFNDNLLVGVKDNG